MAIVTNSLLVGNELEGVKHVELYMIGGYVGGHLAATMGEAAVANMAQFHVGQSVYRCARYNF